MSIVITTDVFCDLCGNWIHGALGPTPNARGARRKAKANGWDRRHVSGGGVIDICPGCREKQNKGERDE